MASRRSRFVIPAKAGIQTPRMRHGIRMTKKPAVYIMANRRNGTLYAGVTSHLLKRVWEHKNGLLPGFTTKYHVHLLVYVEPHGTMKEAISREKQIKKWKRAWKIELIEKSNPTWDDIAEGLAW